MTETHGRVLPGGHTPSAIISQPIESSRERVQSAEVESNRL